MSSLLDALGPWHSGPALAQQVADAVGLQGACQSELWALWQERSGDARPVILLAHSWSTLDGTRLRELVSGLAAIDGAGLQPSVVRLSPDETAQAVAVLRTCLVRPDVARPDPLRAPVDLAGLASERLGQHTDEVAALAAERFAHVELSASRGKRDFNADWADRGWPSPSPAPVEPTARRSTKGAATRHRRRALN